MYTLQFDCVAENALLVTFWEDAEVAEPSANLIATIGQLSQHLRKADDGLTTELIPSYNTLLVYYDFLRVQAQEVMKHIQISFNGLVLESPSASVKTFSIPVYYGSEVALDLDTMARAKNFDSASLVKSHTANVYSLYAIGFSPGFTYLGFVEQLLQTPRKTTPHAHIPAGSVGIADRQTGIYPTASPGGWNIVGRTPINMLTFIEDNEVSVGDKIQFRSIDKEKFLALGGAI